MKNLVDWLVTIENHAFEFYRDSANYFKDDEILSEQLSLLSRDEALHKQTMVMAARLLETEAVNYISDIRIDEQIMKNVEDPVKRGRQLLLTGKLTKEEMLKCISSIEFSEWNDLFIYVVNMLKNESRDFQQALSIIQRHKSDTEKLLDSLPEGKKYLTQLRKLPEIWRPNILIIDDSNAILELLEGLFEDDGITETAENGETGLYKTISNYYDLIITDIDMPIMNGIEFYKKAVKRDPDLKKIILFLTGLSSPDHSRFLEENNLPFVAKPASLTEIREKATRILQSPHTGNPPDTLWPE
ncbi:MAG: response regulator [Calditrichaceae bacterium]